MWKTFDISVTGCAAQAPMDASLLLRSIHIDSVARLVLRVVLATAGQALGVPCAEAAGTAKTRMSTAASGQRIFAPLLRTNASHAEPCPLSMSYFNPSSDKIFGFCSPTARR
jgi:hypothetical protein